jgi:hypothetical protein
MDWVEEYEENLSRRVGKNPVRQDDSEPDRIPSGLINAEGET